MTYAELMVVLLRQEWEGGKRFFVNQVLDQVLSILNAVEGNVPYETVFTERNCQRSEDINIVSVCTCQNGIARRRA